MPNDPNNMWYFFLGAKYGKPFLLLLFIIFLIVMLLGILLILTGKW